MSGSITPYKDGFRLRVSGGTDPDTGKRIRVTEVFHGTKPEARKRLTKMQADLDEGKIKPSTITVAQFVNLRWWPDKAASIGPWSRDSYRRNIDRHIVPVIGDKRLSKVSDTDISAVLRPLTERGVLRTAQYVHTLCSMIFQDAVKRDLRVKSPVDAVPAPIWDKREKEILSMGDWDRVREYLTEGVYIRKDPKTGEDRVFKDKKRPDLVVMMNLFLRCGLRRSELCGLTWGDVDLEGRTITINRAYHVIKGEKYRPAPKSKKSRRAITLAESTVEMLRGARGEAEKLAAMFGRKLSPSTPVCTHDGTHPYAPDTITGLWGRLRAKLDIENVRLHDLRHTSITWDLAAGTPVKEVSDRAGHARAGFTLDEYAHVVPQVQTEAAERLAKLME